MSEDFPIEERFKLLCGINRAAHFEWRRAALATAPDVDPLELIRNYWIEVGHDTAAAYLKMIDRDQPIAPQVAELAVKSSLAMGETASVQPGDEDGVFLMVHTACPWNDWHRRFGLLAEDRPGCDQWMETIAADLSHALGVTVHVETVGRTLPEGGETCTRRFWVEG